MTSGTGPEPAAWGRLIRGRLAAGTDRVLLVQCALDWLRPGYRVLRDAVDLYVLTLRRQSPGVAIDRLVLHNLPTARAAYDGDLARIAAAHAEWIERLDITARLVPEPGHMHIHRLIVAGHQYSPIISDGVHLHRQGSWDDPEAARTVLELISETGRTTPLSGYDIELGGPFGDTDPSVYL